MSDFFQEVLMMWRGQLFRSLVISLVVATSVLAIARDHDRDRERERDRDSVWNPTEENALWRNECGTCHMAFPPGLLASENWLHIMSELDKHFGVDASLDQSVKDEIAGYLKQNGADDRPPIGPDELPRITHTTRFAKKHRSAIRLWSKGQLKSLSDCGACHKDAVTQR